VYRLRHRPFVIFRISVSTLGDKNIVKISIGRVDKPSVASNVIFFHSNYGTETKTNLSILTTPRTVCVICTVIKKNKKEPQL